VCACALVCACLSAYVYWVFDQTDSGWQIASGRPDYDEHSCTHISTQTHRDTHTLGWLQVTKLGCNKQIPLNNAVSTVQCILSCCYGEYSVNNRCCISY